MKKAQNKTCLTVASGFAAFALLCAGVYAATPKSMSVCASIEENDSTVKAFVGDIQNAPANYIQQRAAYLDSLAPITSVEAVIGLNDYYTPEDVADWAESYDVTIDSVYMWVAGETGRLVFRVEDNDIQTGLEIFKSKVESTGLTDEEQQKDYERFLNGEFGVFAITVSASADALDRMDSELGCFNYVDVQYNADVETYAAKVGKQVSYIALPSKPDGAL